MNKTALSRAMEDPTGMEEEVLMLERQRLAPLKGGDGASRPATEQACKARAFGRTARALHRLLRWADPLCRRFRSLQSVAKRRWRLSCVAPSASPWRNTALLGWIAPWHVHA